MRLLVRLNGSMFRDIRHCTDAALAAPFPPHRAPDGFTRLDDVTTQVELVTMGEDYAPAGFSDPVDGFSY
jgi:hypothetical protein